MQENNLNYTNGSKCSGLTRYNLEEGLWTNEDTGLKKPTNSHHHLRVTETEQHCLPIVGEKDGLTPGQFCAAFESSYCATREKRCPEKKAMGREIKSEHEHARVKRWKGIGRSRSCIYGNKWKGQYYSAYKGVKAERCSIMMSLQVLNV